MDSHKLKITILGCGGSGGVPLIGNRWGDCDPANPKNRRSRAAILIEQGSTVILVDTGPDIRQQLLDADLKTLSAVIYTHPHADHLHGIDDLRAINWMIGAPIAVYATPETMAEIKYRFGYIFPKQAPAAANFHMYIPTVEAHEITAPTLTIGDITLRFFEQTHGRIKSLGLRVGPFAYSIDTNEISADGWQALEGVDSWVVDCARIKPHPSHAHLELVLEWVKRLKPRQTYLTHMDQTMDYETLVRQLPPGVAPAYDGLVLEFAV